MIVSFWIGMAIGAVLGALMLAFIQEKKNSKHMKLWTEYGQFAAIVSVGVGGVADDCRHTYSWGFVEKEYPLDDDRNAWYGKNPHYVAWKYKQMEPNP